jgi:hypothetical protein
VRGRTLLGVAVASIALACGDVPTLPGGIAFITPVIAPSPSIAWGDTLRDSLGRAAPLRVFAIGRGGDTIRTITVRYLLTSLNTGATLAGEGLLVAADTLGSLRLVAQVTSADGVPVQLQSAELSIPVVPRADAIAPTTVDTSSSTLPVNTPLPVTVSGVGPTGARGTVAGIRVRYRIASVYPTSATSLTRLFYLAEGNSVVRPDSTTALDTTSSAGVASRSLVGLAPPAGETGADSVVVLATARSERGVILAGSPVKFTVRIRR